MRWKRNRGMWDVKCIIKTVCTDRPTFTHTSDCMSTLGHLSCDFWPEIKPFRRQTMWRLGQKSSPHISPPGETTMSSGNPPWPKSDLMRQQTTTWLFYTASTVYTCEVLDQQVFLALDEPESKPRGVLFSLSHNTLTLLEAQHRLMTWPQLKGFNHTSSLFLQQTQ